LNLALPQGRGVTLQVDRRTAYLFLDQP